MDKKYAINDIAVMLSEKTGEEPAAIEKFLKELISLINEGIIRDQTVNVKGVGTFKVVLVKERESVSVNTGERIVIPPHHKISFIPEKTVKDLINKPFASFDTIEALEEESGLANLTVSEKESANVTVSEKEVTNVTVSEKASEGEQEKKEEKEIPYQEPSRPLSDREIIERIQEQNLVSTPPPLSSDSIPPPLPPPPSPPPAPQPPSQSQSSTSQHKSKGRLRKKKSKKSSTTYLLAILFFLLFVLLAGGGWYFFFYSRSMDDLYTERFNSRIAAERTSALPPDSVLPGQSLNEVDTALDSTIIVQSQIDEVDTTKTEIAEPVATPVSEPPVSTPTPETTPTPATTSPPVTSRPATTNSQPTTTSPTTSTGGAILARVTMTSGQRLTLISEKYYGLKVFWVYIYEFNKEKIGSNPDRIPIGMEILVPTKEFYDIDATSTTSVERATALQRRIMAGY